MQASCNAGQAASYTEGVIKLHVFADIHAFVFMPRQDDSGSCCAVTLSRFLHFCIIAVACVKLARAGLCHGHNVAMGEAHHKLILIHLEFMNDIGFSGSLAGFHRAAESGGAAQKPHGKCYGAFPVSSRKALANC